MPNVKLPNLNSLTLTGYACAAAELRNTTAGKVVANFTLGHNDKWKDAGGEWHTDTLFLPCVAWATWAKVAADKIRKGSAVLVEGKLKQEKYEKDGIEVTATKCTVSRLQVLDVERREENEEQPDTSADVDDVPF